jgi:hypothetical protein
MMVHLWYYHGFFWDVEVHACLVFYVDDCGVLNVIFVESCAVHSLHCLHV